MLSPFVNSYQRVKFQLLTMNGNCETVKQLGCATFPLQTMYVKRTQLMRGRKISAICKDICKKRRSFQLRVYPKHHAKSLLCSILLVFDSRKRQKSETHEKLSTSNNEQFC